MASDYVWFTVKPIKKTNLVSGVPYYIDVEKYVDKFNDQICVLSSRKILCYDFDGILISTIELNFDSNNMVILDKKIHDQQFRGTIGSLKKINSNFVFWD